MTENEEKRKRTRQKLIDAFVQLCGMKSYYDITIDDICKNAKLYRSTFYRYFDTKDSMLREIELEYVEKTRSLTKSLENFHYSASPQEKALFRKELTADMEYHRANAKLCLVLLAPGGDLYFHQKLITSVEKSVEKNLSKYGNPTTDSADFHYVVHFFATGFVSTIYEWLKKDDKTPEQIADFLLAMMKLIRI